MKKELLISIVVPVYNGEKLLEKCIMSIPKCDECEIIVVDDGSTDKTKAIINKLKKKDKRIVSIFKENGGVSSARNAGINKAKGKYIAFLDSDDYYEPNFFKEIVPYLKKNNPDCLNFSFYWLDEKGEKRKNLYPEDGIFKIENSIHNFMSYNYMKRYEGVPWNCIYKKEIIDQHNILFDESLHIGEDRIFKMEFFHLLKEIHCIDNALYNYYWNNNSLTRRDYVPELIDELKKQNNCVIDMMKRQKIKNIYNNDLANYYLSRFYILLKNESLNCFVKGISKYRCYTKFYILKYVRFSKLNIKLKIFYILIKTRLWYLLYIFMYIKNRFHG